MDIPSRDNSTPVFLARNISQHLSGTARTIGAVLVGYFGEILAYTSGAYYYELWVQSLPDLTFLYIC